MNVAHHGVYLSWMELARTELLRAGGVSYAQLEEAGTFLVIARAQVSYRRPVIYDDVLAVTASVTRAGPAKIEHAYEIAVVGRHGEGVQHVREGLVDPIVPGSAFAPIIAAAGETTLGCVDRHGRISRMPTWLSQVPPG
jgi:acyl-CoA thioester hydrolase